MAHRFEKGQAFDITDGAAKFSNQHVDVLAATVVDALFDFVGDVWDDLHGCAEVIAAAFLLDDPLVNLT